ncbi:MAG TPA: hypothetical protein EYQ50_22845 [Verrucomicrobiales bacterium]|nr:hypothetical protein [Verrucomicrobiales bacterium]
MKQCLLGAGWIAAIVVGIASWVQMGNLRDQIVESDLEVVVPDEELSPLEEMNETFDALQIKLDETQKTVVDMEDEKRSMSDQLASLQAELENLKAVAIGDEPDPEAENQRRKEESKQGMMQAQAAAITEMTYSRMFSDLQLDADVETDVTDVLVAGMVEKIAVTQKALKSGDIPASQVFADMEALKTNAHDQLREFLDPATHDKIVSYDADGDRRQLEGTLAPQLATYSSGLTPENKEIVMQLSLDVFDQHQQQFYQSDKMFNLYENADWQINAMDDILGQLNEQLDVQQLGEVERWFNIGKTQMEALKKR